MTVDPQERNTWRSGPEVIKLFSCSTQLSMKFQLLPKKFKCGTINSYIAFKLSEVEFIMVTNVKMPTIMSFIGILTFYEDDKFHAQLS